MNEDSTSSAAYWRTMELLANLLPRQAPGLVQQQLQAMQNQSQWRPVWTSGSFNVTTDSSNTFTIKPPPPEDPNVAWLRRRVDEMCWRAN